MASDASEIVANDNGASEAKIPSIPKMKDEGTENISRGESGETKVELDAEQLTNRVPQWSEMLQTPRGVETFSPSLEVSKSENSHGIG